jgi:phage tail-like protein
VWSLAIGPGESASSRAACKAEVVSERARSDPYRNFRFRVKWHGRYVAGFAKLQPRKPSRRTTSDAVTLERGVTHDLDFESWASKVWAKRPPDAALSDLRIDVSNEAGHLTARYNVLRAWVTEYQAVPDLDANANAVEIEHLKLEHEGFERDDDTPEPDEP